MKGAYIISGAIVMAGALIASAVIFSQGDGSESVAQAPGENVEQQGAENNRVSRNDMDIDGWPSKGDPNAPVLIVEYSDFACPFCKRLNDQTMPQIEQEYVENGDVMLVFKDFTVVGGDRAAEAAHCAAEQDEFWAYHDILFERQESDRGQWNSSDIHRQYANELGLDADALVECFEDRRYQERVAESTREAQANGGRGTPFTLINGTPVAGAQPYGQFREVIEAELADQ